MTTITKDTRVMEHKDGMGRDIGSVGQIFGSSPLIRGEEQPEDASRGARRWWQVSLYGEDVGELRQDATGSTLHI